MPEEDKPDEEKSEFEKLPPEEQRERSERFTAKSEDFRFVDPEEYDGDNGAGD